jgi:hypothetical protein
MIQRIEVELDERGFLKLAQDGLMPKGKFALEVISGLTYTPFGQKYRNLTPQQRAADFAAKMQQWRKDPNRPRVGLTDEQLKRKHIYEE